MGKGKNKFKEEVKEDIVLNSEEVIKEEVLTPVVSEPTIFDKYRKYINQVKDNYISGLEYSDAIAILRYTENALNKTIPMNTSCPQCMMDLVRIFSRLEV